MHGPPPGAPRVLRAFRHTRCILARIPPYVCTRTRARGQGTWVCAYTRAARLRLRDATLRIYQYYFLQLIYYAALRPARPGPPRHAVQRIKSRARHVLGAPKMRAVVEPRESLSRCERPRGIERSKSP